MRGGLLDSWMGAQEASQISGKGSAAGLYFFGFQVYRLDATVSAVG